MQLSFVFLILSTLIYGCDKIEPKIDVADLKKSSLRYFITINYSSISNEMIYGKNEYLYSLYSEIGSFKKTISESTVRNFFFTIHDPFDFAVAITKELD